MKNLWIVIRNGSEEIRIGVEGMQELLKTIKNT